MTFTGEIFHDILTACGMAHQDNFPGLEGTEIGDAFGEFLGVSRERGSPPAGVGGGEVDLS